MRVIKEGVNPAFVPLTVTCNKCHAEIEFLPMEVQRISDQRGGDFYQFACPCCGTNVTRAVPRGYSGPG